MRRKDGSMNFSDLIDSREKAGKPEEPPNLRIAETLVEKVQVTFHDEVTGQEVHVTELNLKTGRLDGQTPGVLSLSARITGKRPEADLNVQAGSVVSSWYPSACALFHYGARDERVCRSTGSSVKR